MKKPKDWYRKKRLNPTKPFRLPWQKRISLKTLNKKLGTTYEDMPIRSIEELLTYFKIDR